MIIAFEPNEVF